MFDRRDVLALAAAGLAFAATGPAFAQSAPPAGETVPLPKLMAEPATKDLWEGKADAPVTIVEYASLTCGHCAHFHNDVYPALKSKYIDAGKVRYVLRDFPLDPLAAAGAMLARCAGDDKRDAVVDLLFAQQAKWLVDKPLDALRGLLKQAGFTQESFDACLKNQTLYDAVLKARETAGKDFGINSTPTFFINGKTYRGAMTVAELETILTPLLAGK
jgi:protein-disulfide isomerase